ncbi:hypothetical protein SERLA73DRAFT_191215 [Serpula lacrymans var. lacrymans S7.3]|uniref:Uncharacterized protein n=2 Tax=Serpula lacrymans var. lacrymans TaxID=341189 RepID=F8QH40_SERL3|nr:uncharacterized protein SERLADRAFT_467181 [Serpula lacrymans var. lacrymans S7.9]EGN92368.1 hypothetical protein SERLA73DRAFT_191215 [Serpula lacrymans var. lacrymans S7.3]EGO24229.1 hypothetical protein SERLADRAFT_467181 [Serpula lacrymans var. lacrymans S7.9]
MSTILARIISDYNTRYRTIGLLRNRITHVESVRTVRSSQTHLGFVQLNGKNTRQTLLRSFR